MHSPTRMLAALTAFIGIGLISGCSPTCADRVWDDTLYVASEHDFDYCGMLRRAENGDVTAFWALVDFGRRTDAGSTYGHGLALSQLAIDTGDEQIAAWARTASDEQRQRLHRTLQSGFGNDPGYRDADYRNVLPRTMAALSRGDSEISEHNLQR